MKTILKLLALACIITGDICAHQNEYAQGAYFLVLAFI